MHANAPGLPDIRIRTSPNLWDLAVRSLNDEVQQLVDFGQIDNLQALREVARLAEEKRNLSLGGRLKIRRRSGENIILRDVFEKIITYVQKFKEVGDVAMQYDPAHAALPWAGVRLLLQVRISICFLAAARDLLLRCISPRHFQLIEMRAFSLPSTKPRLSASCWKGLGWSQTSSLATLLFRIFT